jgi:hypothetical protein
MDETMDPSWNGRNRPRWTESPGIKAGTGHSFFCTGLRGGTGHTGRSGRYQNGIDNYGSTPSFNHSKLASIDDYMMLLSRLSIDFKETGTKPSLVTLTN